MPRNRFTCADTDAELITHWENNFSNLLLSYLSVLAGLLVFWYMFWVEEGGDFFSSPLFSVGFRGRGFSG